MHRDAVIVVVEPTAKLLYVWGRDFDFCISRIPNLRHEHRAQQA